MRTSIFPRASGRLLASAIAWLLVAHNVSARNYLVHTWQTDNGLPQNWVSSLAQTSDGYLWVGTRYGGLARFDGVRFVSFNPQNTPNLMDVQVEFLSVDDMGRLWIVMGNESVTALQDGEFNLFRLPRSDPRLRCAQALFTYSNHVVFSGEYSYLLSVDLAAGTNGWVMHDPRPRFEIATRKIVLDQSNTVWFTTRNQRLSRFMNGELSLANTLPGLLEPRTTTLAVDTSQCLWIASSKQLLQWNGASFEDRTPTNGPPPVDIIQMAFSGDGGLWVLERDRLRKFRDGQWIVTVDGNPLPDKAALNTIQLHGDSRGGVWLIRYGHGFSHVRANGEMHQFTERDGIPNLFITCWFEDAEGDVWIGTAGGGLVRVRETIFTALTTSDGLPGRVVRSVCVDPAGTLWAGTMSGGLAGWKDNVLTPFVLPTPRTPPVESVTVCPDQSGSLWIGSLNHGLMQMRSGTIERDPTNLGKNLSVRILFTDSQNQLWVGGLVNLARYTNGRFHQFGAADGFVDGHAIGAIAEDANGDLWIGTGPGELWTYTKAGRFICFKPPADWPSVRFSAVMPDTNGVVWVGTLGGGLLRFENGYFTRCTLAEGLPDNNVSQLLDSGDGHLWAGTYAGIFRASKSDLTDTAAGRTTRVACRVYGRFDGLPALECSSGFQPSCWRSESGQLSFSTANGVVTLDPKEITPNRVPPRVIIEEMLVDGQTIKTKKTKTTTSTAPTTSIQIAPGRHYVQFRFTGLSFAAPDGVRFRVKLEGGENDWQNLDNRRVIGYGPLLPGNYRFRVIACNNDGLWNDQGDVLGFTILPYFWETWWFKVGLGLIVLVALGIAVALAQSRRYRRKLEKVERQREMEQERARIARDLHDDLGTSLTQISMLSALANRAQTPAAEAKDLINQVRGRSREMIVALDEIVWAVNPKNDSLAGLVNYLGHFAEEFFRATNIRCRLDIPTELPELPLSTELRHHLFLAFKEAVNNAARHSGASEVYVRIEIQADHLIIRFEDNGQGFETKAVSSDQTQDGIVNMRQRLKQIGGHSEFVSTPGKGTIVTFKAPLPRA